MELETYLDAATRRRWQWGVINCTLFCADAALARCGRDPGAGIRGTYSTEAEALAIVEDAGGMLTFIQSRLEGIGWTKIDYLGLPLRDWDIGVVLAPAAPLGVIMQLPAIRWESQKRWVGRAPRSLCAGNFSYAGVWRWE